MSVNTLDQEKRICITCGFCCDGTLFDSAIIAPGEKDFLPDKLKANYQVTEEQEYFGLPCPYFEGKCSIYYHRKAAICSGFRCKILRDLAKNELSPDAALQIFFNVRLMLEEITGTLQTVLNMPVEMSFRLILNKLNSLDPKVGVIHDQKKQLSILTARCNILDALLTRHFKPKRDFDKMIDNQEIRQSGI